MACNETVILKFCENDLTDLTKSQNLSIQDLYIYCCLYISQKIFGNQVEANVLIDNKSVQRFRLVQDRFTKEEISNDIYEDILILSDEQELFKANILEDKKKVSFTQISADISINKIFNLIEYISTLMNNWVKSPDLRINQIVYLNRQSADEICTALRGRREFYSQEISVFKLFLAQWKYSGDKLAFIDFKENETIKYTYDDIYRRCIVLLQKLASMNLQSNSIIAVYGKRSINTIVSLLAIIELGFIYMPIDTSFPEQYIKGMLADANPVLMIGKCDFFNGSQIDEALFDKDMVELVSLPERAPSKISFLLYTSGSTGKPKGVMHSERQLINRLIWMWNNYQFEDDDIFAQRCTVSTIPSLWDMLGGVLCGKPTIIIPDLALNDPSILADFIYEYQISFMTLSPSILSLLNQTKKAADKLSSLRQIIVLGEPFTENDYQCTRKILNNTLIINDYGSTEINTVLFQNFYKEDSFDVPFRTVSNLEVFILDDQFKICGYDIVGQLAVAGVCVMHGYLNQQELNTLKIKQVEINEVKKRVFLTGDLGTVSSNGKINILGRCDRIVKIHGKRVDLDGIDSIIKNIQGIKDSVTIALNINNKMSIASLIMVEQAINEIKIKQYIYDQLQEQIPTYMHPRTVKLTERIPLLPNGKRDLITIKKTLSSSDNIGTNCIQDMLGSIFESVLGINIDKNNRKTEFTYMGMDSYHAMELITRIRNELKINDDVSILYNYPNFELLSNYLNRKEKKNEDQIEFKSLTKIESKYAIIGMSGRFSGCQNVDQLWELLLQGRNAIGEIPLERFDISEVYSADKNENGKSYSKWCGYIPDINDFDPLCFGVSTIESQNMNVRQKLLIVEAYKTMENAGYPEPGGNVGIFVGADYHKKNNDSDRNSYSVLGDDLALLANRISYIFNYLGPSMVINTACSSSLSAIHMACLSLKNNDCEIALVGGINILDNSDFFIDTSRLKVFSAQGSTNTFGDNADGFVAGEGVAFIALKRLEQAIEDKDYIYSVIHSSVINQDGKTSGITSPNGLAQYRLLQTMYQKNKIDISTIDYFETHGTGTKIGDVIEINALKDLYRGSITDKCVLGSVKPNIGHLIHGAGIASVIKAALMINRRTLLPNSYIDLPNTQLDWDTLPFRLIDQPEVYQKQKNLRVGVSSFGIGGSNGHCILEEYTSKRKILEKDNRIYPILIENMISEKMDYYLSELLGWLRDHNKCLDLANFSYSLLCRMVKEKEYVVLLVSSNQVLDERIELLKNSQTKYLKPVNLFINNLLLFVYPDHGKEYNWVLNEDPNYFQNIIDKNLLGIFGDLLENLQKIPLPSSYIYVKQLNKNQETDAHEDRFIKILCNFNNNTQLTIDEEHTLEEIGFDSLKILELRQTILREFGIDIKLSDLNYLSIRELRASLNNKSSISDDLIKKYQLGNIEFSSLNDEEIETLYEYLKNEVKE